MLFVSEFLIGVEIGSLHTTILRGWKGILFCLIAASATSFLMVISAAFLKMVRAKCIFTERVVFARKTRLHVLNWSRHRLKLSS